MKSIHDRSLRMPPLGGVIAAFLLFLYMSGGPVMGQSPPPPPNPTPAGKASPSEWKQQKATMASFKAIAAAWETYFNDFGSYCPRKVEHPALRWDNIGPKAVETLLVPTYIQQLPLRDGWDAPIQFAVRCAAKGEQTYGLRSAGSDGRWDGEDYKPGTKTLKPTADIVFSNGQFVQSPEGMTK